ncbi:hypothetical protein FEM48_ZijujUnG0123000 [Ziziphus jujuba var. spinosa]|uniref:PGG domain-containing protein n=1 Tax=Ziziphus jujuba var. spinosa TaxID=714518 RepID=A0A978U7S3_ZIZJJ|nr:hypothetical protein FEM48_ZijujUnG0123000 [Ziziphus jujuba var. spinosa]
MKEGRDWLIKTSESCSVVAALIAGGAFATSAAIPGGTLDTSGKPIFETQPAFQVFSISSLLALCFSVTALVMFLAIITSRFQEKDFDTNLPVKLLLGLSSLFVSIAAMLVCFCTGHFFMIGDKLKYAAYPVYALTCFPVSIFAAAQFPLYIDLLRTTFKNPFEHLSRYKYMTILVNTKAADTEDTFCERLYRMSLFATTTTTKPQKESSQEPMRNSSKKEQSGDKTSESCSVVAALISDVAFATSAAIPILWT